MNRTSARVSLMLVVALASVAGCSSKTDSSPKGGTGGTDASTAGTSSGGSGGTSATAGGSNTGTGGSGTHAGGSPATGGTASGGACNGQTVTCVDATTASQCDDTTGMTQTFNCVEEAKALGIVSSGCTKDAMGDHCAVDSFSDQECVDGAAAYGFCANMTTDDDLFNLYVACFQNAQMVQSALKCFGKYVNKDMHADTDCETAKTKCLSDTSGAAGAPGAGGAP